MPYKKEKEMMSLIIDSYSFSRNNDTQIWKISFISNFSSVDHHRT